MISDMIYYFEKKDIKYVENVVWVQLNESSIIGNFNIVSNFL